MINRTNIMREHWEKGKPRKNTVVLNVEGKEVRVTVYRVPFGRIKVSVSYDGDWDSVKVCPGENVPKRSNKSEQT